MERKEITIKIKELFPELIKEFSDFDSLVLRESGLRVRMEIEKILEEEKNAIIVLDFSGLELITQGFADEIIGVLIRKRGLSFVKERIKAINMNEFIRGTLNWVASYSKKMVTTAENK
ncbi:MAG: STAS-like domain-containing protein [Sulfurihydrogenibium sp.]|jgi:hypothetical protein|nr:STAS-like domain-containing protein [Sulfurihydrogenibium sp.]